MGQTSSVKIVLSSLVLLIVMASLLLADAPGYFIERLQDPKELIFYLFCFVCSLGGILSGLCKKAGRRSSIDLSWLAFLVVLFVVYRINNSFFSAVPVLVGWRETGSFVLFVLTVVVLAHLERPHLDRLLRVFTIVAAVILLTQFAYSYPYFVLVSTDPDFGSVGHVTYLSALLLLIIPWLVYIILSSEHKVMRYLVGSALILVLAALATICRISTLMGFVAAVVASLILFMVRRDDATRRLLKCFTAGLVLFFMVATAHYFLIQDKAGYKPDLLTRITQYTSGVDQDLIHPWRQRRLIYQSAVHEFLERPVMGWGYGSFRYTSAAFMEPGPGEEELGRFMLENWLDHPHNDVLYQLVEGGVTGLVLYYLVIGVFIGGLVRQRRRMGQRDSLLIDVILIMVVMLTVSFQYESVIVSPMIKFFLLPLFVLGTHLHLTGRAPPVVEPGQRGVLMTALPVVLLAGWFALVPSYTSYLLRVASRHGGGADSHLLALRLSAADYQNLMHAGHIEANRGHLQVAEAILTKAQRLYPLVPEIYAVLGEFYFKHKRYEEARKILTQGHEVFPLYQPVNFILEKIKK